MRTEQFIEARLAFMSIISGVLLAAPWIEESLWPLIFVSLVPLLLVLYEIEHKKQALRTGFYFCLTSFFVWNVCSGWWLVKSTFAGFGIVLLVNPFISTIPVLLWFKVRNQISPILSHGMFVASWVAWEWVQLHVNALIPWLVVGNSLSGCPDLIQWYEFTGVLGGSVWILAINLAIANGIRRVSNTVNTLVTVTIVVLVPVVFSFVVRPKQEGKPIFNEIIAIQPNIDCYSQKFVAGTQSSQIEGMIQQASEGLTDSTDFVIFPETAIHESVDEDSLLTNKHVKALLGLSKSHPRLTIITGCATRKGDKTYNSLLFLRWGEKPQVYHKNKLVPGVEYLPGISNSTYASRLLLSVGDTGKSFDNSPQDTTFHTKQQGVTIIPAICYESVYGEYLATNSSHNPGFIIIVTNDGWWGNTPGHKQHFNLARLRAIETRRSVIQCANTGITGAIHRDGKTVKASRYGERCFVKGRVELETRQTIYTAWGDWIGYMCVGIVVLILCVHVFTRKTM